MNRHTATINMQSEKKSHRSISVDSPRSIAIASAMAMQVMTAAASSRMGDTSAE